MSTSRPKSVTNEGMKATATSTDVWLTESLGKGHGALLGRIAPSGARSFYFRYTGTHGQVRLPIGPYLEKGDGEATFTVAQARKRALKWSAMRREEGITDLREHLAQRDADRRQAEDDARRAAQAERDRVEAEARARDDAEARRITVRRLFDQWQRAELTPQTLADGTRIGRKDGGEWVRQSFERRVFPVIGDTAAEDVRKADLLAILDTAKEGGHRRTANVLLADLRQMFRFAADRELVPKNPLAGIKRATVGGKDVERDRTLSDDELRALWASVPRANLSPRTAAAIWLILATACRVGEAMAARWEHIDTESRTWFLPTSKNQRDHTIHLSRFAMARVQTLAELREAGADGEPSPWVFPNTAGVGPVCIKSFGKQLADRQRTADRRMTNRTRMVDALALAGGKWTAHDLRRTAATLMARLGVSTDVIDEALNHKLQSKVARTYIKDRRLGEQARAFEALGERLEALVSTQGSRSNVVPMRVA